MKRILLLTCFGVLLSCNCQNTSNRRNSIDDPALVTTSYFATNEDTGTGVAEDASGETLNDIRFAEWTKKEWADNEYIREVRRYINAYNKGEIENSVLDAHKGYMQGKFIILARGVVLSYTFHSIIIMTKFSLQWFIMMWMKRQELFPTMSVAV